MKNTLERILGSAWDVEGVLGRLRRRKLDLVALEALTEELSAIQTTSSISKREVALLWYVPLFLFWQRQDLEERLPKEELDKFDVISNGILAQAERILGVP